MTKNRAKSALQGTAGQMFGLVIKINKKLVMVVSANNRQWKIPPGLLRIMNDVCNLGYLNSSEVAEELSGMPVGLSRVLDILQTAIVPEVEQKLNNLG